MRRSLRLLFVLFVLQGPTQRAFAEDMKERAVWKAHSADTCGVAFSPDGKILASTGLGEDVAARQRWTELRLWDAATGKERATWRDAGGICNLAFSPDGKTIAAESRGLSIWDVATGKTLATFEAGDHYIGLPCLQFSADGKRLGEAGDTVARIWDLSSGKQIISFRRAIRGPMPTFSPDLTLLASRNYQDIDLWDVETGKVKGTLADHRGSVGQPAFTADGKIIAVPYERGLPFGDWVSEVKLWEVATGKARTTVGKVDGRLWKIAFSPDGKTLALVWSRDHVSPLRLHLLDVETDQTLGVYAFKKNHLNSVTFSPDGKTLTASCSDGTVRLWDVPRLKGK